jgi:peroxiredoxin
MTLTPSAMLDLGTPLPSFSLPDLDGTMTRAADVSSQGALLVIFICPHCPFVEHIRSELACFGREYQAKGLAIVAINANDASAYPEDSLEGMRQEAAEAGYTFPYLHDASQDVARAFHAACTPDVFLFDRDRRLAYRGQFDDSRPGNGRPVSGADLRAAADAVLAGRPAPADQRPSIGCNIKWKPGARPI